MNPIGMMFALIAGVILLPALYMGVSNYGDQVRATATALQMAHIQKAAEAYITTYAAAVEANSTASSEVTHQSRYRGLGHTVQWHQWEPPAKMTARISMTGLKR